MQRHALTAHERARLEPLLPRPPRTGRPPKDHRVIVNALPWLLATGAPWRDLPERYGPWRTVATERNVVERLVGKLKEYRRIATRYDKLAASYLAFVQLAAIRIWL
jgi:transposase